MRVAQKEALINEYKGNLFEFIVANELSKLANIEKSFLSELDPGLKKQLVIYQEELRKIDNDLFTYLPQMGSKTALEIFELVNRSISSIKLIGKLGAHPGSDLSESDFVLISNKIEIPISLKLSKEGTSVHTKSAGSKSLFNKYFGELEIQAEFNRFLELRFEEMAINLHASMDIEYDLSFNNWKQEEQPELPGELAKEQSQILKKHYAVLITEIYNQFLEIYQNKPERFQTGLKSLLGLTRDDILQIKCLYEHADDRYQYQRTEVISLASLNFEKLFLIEPKEGNSFFQIKIGELVTQMRIKPMNKFTVPAFKLNCSFR